MGGGCLQAAVAEVLAMVGGREKMESRAENESKLQIGREAAFCASRVGERRLKTSRRVQISSAKI